MLFLSFLSGLLFQFKTNDNLSGQGSASTHCRSVILQPFMLHILGFQSKRPPVCMVLHTVTARVIDLKVDCNLDFPGVNLQCCSTR